MFKTRKPRESSTFERISKLFKNFKKKFIKFDWDFLRKVRVIFFGGVFEFNLVSLIRVIDFTVRSIT